MITLPGQTRIVVWDDDKYKGTEAPEDFRWYGVVQHESDPPSVDIWKKCSTPPHTSVHITATLSDIAIEADGVIKFNLIEASDFSIVMIEAIKTLKVMEAHAKGELYGPHSDGDIRYE